MNGRILTMMAAVAAIFIAIFASAGVFNAGTDDDTAKPAPDRAVDTGDAPSDALRVSMAVSDEKVQMLTALVKQFNSERHQIAGKAVFVELQKVSSGDAVRLISEGKLKPTIWSPASSLWGRVLNQQADKDWVAESNPSLVRTPLVIAMWEPMAQALGWPRKKLGFSDVLRLANDPRGWASAGKPQYGAFKLGHPDPLSSTSGLSAVVAEYYAATGKSEGLTVEDVSAQRVRDRIQQIEQSIVHYGNTTNFFSAQLKKNGPAYASAVAMEETTLIEFNRTRGDQMKMVGIYPKEGTFFSDNPLITMNADWVTPEHKQAAELVTKTLVKQVTPQVAARFGFRPADLDVKPRSPVDAEHGADPAQPKQALAVPNAATVSQILKFWPQDRKPANVALVFDTSGSMKEPDGDRGGQKIIAAKKGLKQFFAQINPRDRVGLITFNTDVSQTVPLDLFSKNKDTLISETSGLLPDGKTALYEAVHAGVQQVKKLADPTRINAVVVLSDGANTVDRMSLDRLLGELRRQNDAENEPIRVFTIAYGQDAAEAQQSLRKISEESGGMFYEGRPESIEQVYRNIATFF